MKDWKYILYVGLAILLFVAVKITAPKQYHWIETFAHDDKNPFGAYAFNDLLPGMFDEKVHHSYKTIYELKDSLDLKRNLLIITSTFSPEQEDVNALLKFVTGGGNVFISSEYFYGKIADTLNITHQDYLMNFDSWQKKDTAYVNFANPYLDSGVYYQFRRDHIHNCFSSVDTTNTTVIARNDHDQPIAIRVKYGRGNFFLNTTPVAFTNIYLLSGNNHKFVESMLSYLPNAPVHWTEFYHMGRMESATPLRYVLSNGALRWAYYITIVSILLFMLVESKRKQRIIPVIKPLPNTTLEFVTTIGNLYYQTGSHKDLAEKKILFFYESIRTNYLLQTNSIDDIFVQALALKSGRPLDEVSRLFRTIRYVQESTMISPEQLIDLNNKIEKFHSHG